MTAVNIRRDDPPRTIGEIGAFHAAAVYCGLKSEDPGRAQGDLALIWSERECAAAGVFTRNKVAAAPVDICRERLRSGSARAIVVNAGNANCCTGEQGRADAKETARVVSEMLDCPEDEVLIASTGVIGRPLPMDKLRAGLSDMKAAVASGRREDVAAAIMTTDTVPKSVSVSASLGGISFSVAGIAKGAGMIAPDMATMLSFVLTDLSVAPDVLQASLCEACAQSFNRVTIDGDTSTNDTLIVMADGSAGNDELRSSSGELHGAFSGALTAVCVELSKKIAADGEGAEHFVEVSVEGAASEREATAAARTIAESPLVKTAIAGNDPNWGRILAAAGRAGIELDPAKATVSVNGVEVFTKGEPRPENEELAGKALKREEVRISVSLGLGSGAARIWTCDLTHGYIEINADYHT